MSPSPLTDPEVLDLLGRARGGHRASLARLVSMVERGGDDARSIGRLAHPMGGNTFTIGVTGAPGAGKSTLTSALCRVVRAEDDAAVAVLSIDPSSPFSGGAILGDRVRMTEHTLDPGVFIRSMATRGHLGGLALATPQAVRVLDAVGVPTVIIETVGVGQVEVEVAGAADTVVVVMNPGWGDAVQANKAGLMEIADVFVINKADRPGAGDTRRDIEQMLSMRTQSGWRPPVLETVATTGAGIGELWEAITAHRAHLVDTIVDGTSGLDARRRLRVTAELRGVIAAELQERARLRSTGGDFADAVDGVIDRRIDPWTAADALLGA